LYPWFRPLSLAVPFLLFLLLAAAIPPGFFQAVFAAAAFVLILGIKDLLIVHRRNAYELLVFLLTFAGCLLFFELFPSWASPASFPAAALAALLWFLLIAAAPERKEERSWLPPALAALLFFEIASALLFLPLGFFSEAALLFLGSTLLFEVATNFAAITSRQFLLWSAGYAALAFIVSFLAPWKV